MRWLFTSFPAYGHFHPIASLALAAQQLGHEVRVATGPDLAPWVRRCGLPVVEVGVGQAEALAVAQARYPGPRANAHLFTDIWVDAALPGLVELADSFRPELVVHEEADYAGALLATVRGLPLVTHSWPGPLRPAAGRRAILALLEESWARHAPGTRARTSGEIYLDACPRPFQTHEIGEIEGAIAVQAALFDGPVEPPPSWLETLPRPAAYLTLGTVSLFSTPSLLTEAITAIAPRVASLVVTTGPNPPSVLGDLPSHVFATSYLPQSQVLPRVDVVVGHGGPGTTVGGLLHALPQLVLPQLSQSQVLLADAVVRNGLGLSLTPPEQTREKIAECVGRLFDDPRFAARAKALRAEARRGLSATETVAMLAPRFGGAQP